MDICIFKKQQQQTASNCQNIWTMTESIPITYPYKATNEILKKKHKEKLLKDRPETLYSDLYKNGEVSNIIFYTEDPEAWHSAIRQHYPHSNQKGHQ